MEKENEKKGFTIRDRRAGSPQEEAGKTEEKRKGLEEESPQGKTSSSSLPEITFSSFVFSLSTSALMHLGEVPDPISQKLEKDLPLAKQTIDILGMLQEKTRGNLTPEEEKLMENLLGDLRWRYVQRAKD